jgi:hypothetical protein
MIECAVHDPLVVETKNSFPFFDYKEFLEIVIFCPGN